MARAVVPCSACRHTVLDTFAALAGISITPVVRTKYTRQQPHHALTRSLSTSRRRLATPPLQSDSGETSTPAPAPIPSSIPWYLQVETPSPPAPVSPHLALQEIPPIPDDAPPILSPLLTHLSVQIGLDNLALLDLRDLDPPPALGANLIMVLGTARSYKHLNTSADRFSRWLRSTYKLKPYADGLLGRNQLKLKLRRKARKMKLAQSVGNTVAVGEATDDGITTGWICVNLGTLEGVVMPEQKQVGGDGVVSVPSRAEQEELSADEEEYENPVDDGYIGFGSRSLAPRIVVQMFTEAKRLEMDLEGLWDFRQQRRASKAERAATLD